MNNVKDILSRVAFAFVIVGCLSFFASAQDSMEKKLPEGMTGPNVNDPRANLSAGLFDAGEATLGMKHLALLKKPTAFQLGTDDANDPRVKAILGSLGVPDPTMIPEGERLIFAQLAFANSDLAFQGNHLFLGNFYGVSIYDIADPSNAKLLTSMVCPGGQGDVSVYKNLMFMSVEMPNGRLDCGTQGFPADPANPQASFINKDRFRGVRIFDISNIQSPKQVGAVQTCRGSHTHTLVTDPKDKDNVYIYVSGTSYVRPSEELAGCSDGNPNENQNISRFSIDVIKVPVATPKDAKIVASPRIFGDGTKINTLNDGGSHDGDGTPQDTDQCHDITVYPEIGLAAGACSGNGILLDIKNPASPKRIEEVNDKNFAYWHSAAFSNDGKKVIFTDEWGGGTGARCRATDPNVWGANAIFNRNGNNLEFQSYYKLPTAQTESENCVAHNGSLIPVPGRDIKVQSWYQGGISVSDFTDAKNPMEIAYFDRGPIYEDLLVLGGTWSAYWYNGNIYSSEIARGLDILELTPTENLTQNEIDAARSVKVSESNVQTQKMIVYPKTLTVAKAYIDQLDRSKSLSAEKIAEMRSAISAAESSNMGKKETKQLKKFASTLKKEMKTAKTSADSARMSALAEILKKPMM